MQIVKQINLRTSNKKDGTKRIVEERKEGNEDMKKKKRINLRSIIQEAKMPSSSKQIMCKNCRSK